MKVYYHVRMWGYFESPRWQVIRLSSMDGPASFGGWSFRLCS